jgi:excisionase family DNA binding protein
MAILTAKQAADRLGVATATIYSLCGSRRLKHQRIGVGRGVIRIQEEDLQAYSDGATVGLESDSSPDSSQLRHIKPR